MDADPAAYTVDRLRGWKRGAQERALRELLAPRTTVASSELDRVRAAVATDNASDAEFDALIKKIGTAAQSDLMGYTCAPLWARIPIELTLRLCNDDKTPPFSISKLPPALEAAPELTIVAPPGTGKTTTLLQLARHALSAGLHVPLYFPLANWAASEATLFASLRQRAAFKDIATDELQQLAERGRLLLLLDGWNELDTKSQDRLRREIDQIRHDWPHIRIVASTRRRMLDVPMSGPTIEINSLSDEQELAIARMQSGDAGAKIVDAAWRTPGVRALIATPLYLTALVAGGNAEVSPTTKEGLLRLFVKTHERVAEHAEALLALLHGCHTEVLVALASQMTEVGTAALTEADARRVVTLTLTTLRKEGQLAAVPEPRTVLDVLTDHHTLVRSGGTTGTISFQHQQIQEWFASNEVAELMRGAARGDENAVQRLRGVVIDRPAWEEAVTFAVERLSREPDGPKPVVHAIRLAVQIDPMLAAEMIFRSGDEVWPLVSAEVTAFVERWHTPGKVDRAVRFMIMTGRPEFAQYIWPLVSSEDTQVQLPTLRTAPRFRPSVLGEDVAAKVAALSDKVREHFLALLASESGLDGMDLAVELAKADPKAEIQAHVVQQLQFRRANRHVAALLAASHDRTWTLVANQGYAEEIVDPKATARLREERKKLLRETTAPAQRLGLLLEESSAEPGRDAAIADAIADPQFPARDSQTGSLYEAEQRAPAAVLAGLRRRLEAGLELPFHVEEALEKLDTVDDGPIATAILDVSKDRREDHAVPALAGPKVVSALIDEYLTCMVSCRANRTDQALWEKAYKLADRVRSVRPGPFIKAVLAPTKTEDAETISSLAHLISNYGESSGPRKPILPIDGDAQPAFVNALRRWARVLVSSSQSKRSQLADLASAIGRIGAIELLPELKNLLDEDLRRRAISRAGFREARQRGDIEAASDASTSYANWYQAAFAALGGDETARVVGQYLENREFGFEAALVLKEISDKALNIADPGPFKRWPWFDEVTAARKKASRSDSAASEKCLRGSDLHHH